jgi:hypothetical protein
MWFRFFAISFLKFVVSTFGLFALYAGLLPASITGGWLIAITWFITFLLAFLFAHWALLHTKPGSRHVLSLVFVWLLVTVCGFLVYGIFISDRGPWILVNWEILGQIGLEIVAILTVAYRVRQNKVTVELGETVTSGE